MWLLIHAGIKVNPGPQQSHNITVGSTCCFVEWLKITESPLQEIAIKRNRSRLGLNLDIVWFNEHDIPWNLNLMPTDNLI